MARNTYKTTPIHLDKETFRRIGHQLVDDISILLDELDQRRVTPGETPTQLQQVLGSPGLPEEGMPAEQLVARATQLLFNHSLFNGHPKFMGYITSSAAPIGVLGDLLAAAVNANVGAQVLSPMATEIEKQTVQWLAELIGLPEGYGGLLVSGGNMANFTGFLAGRHTKAPTHVKEQGLSPEDKLTVYCSRATHTWIDKAVSLFGMGTDSIRWIETDAHNRMDVSLLEKTILDDLDKKAKPIMVIATAGDVSTGAVDDFKAIASLCKKHNLWFHIDGAYGIPAAALPELSNLFEGIGEADSIALDPHKWLYSPLEAGCTLVKNPRSLTDTYSSHPVYYNFDSHDVSQSQNFYEYGFQNSRGFRALKVWLALQQVGRKGYIQLIGEDIALAETLYLAARAHPELEAITHNLSITTLRYVPEMESLEGEQKETYVNKLNETLLNTLQDDGKVFMSNAVINGKYCLRFCIVNFRTTTADIPEIIELVTIQGRKTHEKMQHTITQSS